MCDMFDESYQCTIVLPDECLGYGLVVPFPAYGFAALVSHNENLNSSLNRARDDVTRNERAAGGFRWLTSS